MLLASLTSASADVKVHATCAAELSRETSHVRTLRDEVARALAGTPETPRYTIDVSLVQLGTSTVGKQLEVRAEVRALLSDEQGRARYQTTSRAVVRGHVRDRALLQRDAVRAVARDVATALRTRTKS